MPVENWRGVTKDYIVVEIQDAGLLGGAIAGT
jgi:hypothetical protein